MAPHSETDNIADQVSPTLLTWYDRHARRLPWRSLPGEVPDPYHVWLSEIMLQQTTVATVGDYFRKFLALWPDIHALASAELDQVLTAWAGLGYYARARNLHKCAQVVVRDHNGQFPDTVDALITLPGIGRYTAAAIAAIAFNHPAAVMDGNIERVTSRLYRIKTPLPAAKPELYQHVAAMTPDHRPGDFAQAMMDLGATICVPAAPKCILCPLIDLCSGREIAATLPRKQPKKTKPTRRGSAFWIERPDGAVLLRRRPEKGLLGGMMEFPSTAWSETDSTDFRETGLNFVADSVAEVGDIRHTFTHFHLEIRVFRTDVTELIPPDDCVWCAPDRLDEMALPTLMRKIAKRALTPMVETK